MHWVGFTSYNFSVILFPGWGGEEGTKGKRQLREGNRISNSFMIYLFPPWGCRGILALLQDGLAVPGSSCKQLGNLNLSHADCFQPSHGCYRPGIWWISAPGQDIMGPPGRAGGHTWLTESPAPSSSHQQNSLEPK